MTWLTHTWPIRVYYEDTDHGGVVYYANYLKFMERARTEMLRDAGIELDELEEDKGLLFAVTSVSIRFGRPARFNDLLEVESRIVHARGARIRFHQFVRNRKGMLVEAHVEVACMNRKGRPTRIPGDIMKKIQKQRSKEQ
jgi:acyl-CoA thioester hydrolase